MNERDPFWDNEARVEAAKWNWPRAVGAVAFWAAICFIAYLIARYG